MKLLLLTLILLPILAFCQVSEVPTKQQKTTIKKKAENDDLYANGTTSRRKSPSGHAQIPDVPHDESGKINYTDVAKTDSAGKDALYTRAKMWMVEKFKSANSVIQMDDKEAGILVGKGFTEVEYNDGALTYSKNLYFTIKIYVKDNRYKYEVTDMSLKWGNHPYTFERALEYEFSPENCYKANGKPRPSAERWCQLYDATIKGLIYSLKKSMSASVASKADF